MCEQCAGSVKEAFSRRESCVRAACSGAWGRRGGCVQLRKGDVAVALLQRCGGVRTVWARLCSTAGAAWGRREGGMGAAWWGSEGGVSAGWCVGGMGAG